MKEFKFYMIRRDDGFYREDEVWSDNEKGRIYFNAHDLSEEDAIIGREIFDGMDFINAIRLGFEIAQQGYDSIKVITAEAGEGNDIWTEKFG